MIEPIFDWKPARAAGVLLHPTALPGRGGIGTLGRHARRFIDFLEQAGFRYWQMCPLGYPGFGRSPYQCFSAFAGNPNLIDLEVLVSMNLLKEDDLTPLKSLSAERVDFDTVDTIKPQLIARAHQRFHAKGLDEVEGCGSFRIFNERNASWLDPYALYMALKHRFEGTVWQEWPSGARTPARALDSPYIRDLSETIGAFRFGQYLFFGQWRKLREYANGHDVSIIGDIPIYVALDSADTWADRDVFDVDDRGAPRSVAGVPPDYFAEDGQLWGNPLYDWQRLEQTGYDWWIRRLEMNFTLFDVIRLDHFRGFESFWRIPAGAKTARKGKWIPGPGLDFLAAVKHAFPEAKLIAEDLGDITPAVRKMTTDSGLPGMAVLQFAFTREPDNAYLPHHLERHCVVYPGTHDNDTILGWWHGELSEERRDQVRRYFRIGGEEISYDLIRAAYRSVCSLTIIPMQDLLALGSEARFNIPGTVVSANWRWRCLPEQLDQLRGDTAAYLRDLAWLYDRGPSSRGTAAPVRG